MTTRRRPTAEPQALPGDGLREGIVDELRRHLGEALVDTELKPNDDLWVRVATDSWKAAGDALHAMGFEYFCFLSAIDWMPSPYGRGEDDPTEPPPERTHRGPPGRRPAARPGSRCSPGSPTSTATSASRSRSTSPTTR